MEFPPTGTGCAVRVACECTSEPRRRVLETVMSVINLSFPVARACAADSADSIVRQQKTGEVVSGYYATILPSHLLTRFITRICECCLRCPTPEQTNKTRPRVPTQHRARHTNYSFTSSRQQAPARAHEQIVECGSHEHKKSQRSNMPHSS